MALEEQDRGLSISVMRAFELLDRVGSAGADGITLAKLSAGTPKARSTTHRYVTTLLALGAIRRDEAGRLRLGLKILELASGQLEGDNLRAAAEPILRDLGERTGETAHLGVPSEGHVVYIAKVESPQSVRLVSGSVGDTVGNARVGPVKPRTSVSQAANRIASRTRGTATTPPFNSQRLESFRRS